jgi:hypothetical protein
MLVHTHSSTVVIRLRQPIIHIYTHTHTHKHTNTHTHKHTHTHKEMAMSMSRFKLALFAALIAVYTSLTTASKIASSRVAPKYYACVSGSCQLQPQTTSSSSSSSSFSSINATQLTSQSMCLLTCGQGNMWPYPNADVVDIKEGDTVSIRPVNKASGVFAKTIVSDRTRDSSSIVHGALDRLESGLQRKLTRENNSSKNKDSSSGAGDVELTLDVQYEDNVSIFALGVDESYSLSIDMATSTHNKEAVVKITAQTVFGALHGLETLSQLITFDPLSNGLVVASSVTIVNDKPRFPYRGLMLDVSRHYLSMESLRRNILAMVSRILLRRQ